MTLTYIAPLIAPSDPSPQLRAAQSWMEAANALDREKAMSITTDSYSHVFLPEDAGLPVLTKEQWISRLQAIGSMMAVFKMDIKEIVESPGIVAFYSSVYVKTKGGNVSETEVILILYLTEQPDGSFKVCKVRDFVDTLKFAKFDADVKKEFGLPTA